MRDAVARATPVYINRLRVPQLYSSYIDPSLSKCKKLNTRFIPPLLKNSRPNAKMVRMFNIFVFYRCSTGNLSLQGFIDVVCYGDWKMRKEANDGSLLRDDIRQIAKISHILGYLNMRKRQHRFLQDAVHLKVKRVFKMCCCLKWQS